MSFSPSLMSNVLLGLNPSGTSGMDSDNGMDVKLDKNWVWPGLLSAAAACQFLFVDRPLDFSHLLYESSLSSKIFYAIFVSSSLLSACTSMAKESI